MCVCLPFPDAVLECLGSIWELHCPYLCESETLTELYRKSKKQRHTLLQERTGDGMNTNTTLFYLRHTHTYTHRDV